MDLMNLLTPSNLGVGTAIAGVIAIVVGIMNYFSPERLKQRIRLEESKLLKEKETIENSQPTTESSARLVQIEKRLGEIADYFKSQ